MKIQKVLLISHNFLPEPTGIGKYNGEMIEWLSNNNYDCTVVTTFPYYPHWQVQAPYTNRWYKKEVLQYKTNHPVTVYRCPSYIPQKPTGKKRMMQDMSFWMSKSWIILKILLSSKKFDLIITVAPPFHLAYLGLFVRKFNGGKLLYHIQDLQIEAAQDLGMLSSKKLFETLYKVERNILTKADFISSISEGMIDKIKAKIDKEVILFPNWADTGFFFPILERETLKTAWGYKPDDIIFLYSGAIGEKQGLENIVSAAEELRNNDDIKFIICGSGPYKDYLIKLAADKGLTNINFVPVQDKEKFNEFLNLGDFHLVLQKSNAGDLVMPSKLTTILAVGGVSIVTSSPGTSLYNVINKHDLGYIIEPDDYLLLVEAIQNAKSDKKVADVKRSNARKYALQFLDINNVMTAFMDEISVKSVSPAPAT